MIFKYANEYFHNVCIYLILAFAYVILASAKGYRATGAQSESPRDVTSEAFLFRLVVTVISV